MTEDTQHSSPVSLDSGAVEMTKKGNCRNRGRGRSRRLRETDVTERSVSEQKSGPKPTERRRRGGGGEEEEEEEEEEVMETEMVVVEEEEERRGGGGNGDGDGGGRGGGRGRGNGDGDGGGNRDEDGGSGSEKDNPNETKRVVERKVFVPVGSRYSWDGEYLRLSRLYGARVVSEGPESGVSEVGSSSRRSSSIQLSLLYEPSDPDFPFSKLSEYSMQSLGSDSSREKCQILLHITVPSGYPKENMDQVILDAPEYRHISSKFNEMFQESVSRTSSTQYPIYEAIKVFDRGFSDLVLNRLPSVESINEHILLSWTPVEQKLLEEAICYYKYTKDVNKKWSEIANHVGHGKTVKQCIERYKYCRSLVAGKKPEKKSTEEGSGAGGAGVESGEAGRRATDGPSSLEGPAEGGMPPVEDLDRMSLSNFESLLFSGLEICSVDLILMAVLRVQVYCSRCREVNDYRPISIPGNQDLTSNEQGETRDLGFLDKLILGSSQNCRKCGLKHSIYFSPLICHSNDLRIGKMEFSDCSLRDILPSDILVSCSNCSNFLRVREFFVGKQYSVSCRNCFKELRIRAGGLTIGEEIFNVDKSTDFLLAELGDLKKLKRKTNSKDSKLPTAVGTPLPANGTCSHYKKSNRWNRFPCCNKAYPCHECHDKDNPDHKFDWAKQMICGFCSREQGFSDNCKYCRANLIGKTGNASGRFWEGGKGCRNPLTLSNRDSRKLKLISRQLKKT
ncbi:zinc finger-containing and myb DNA binding domain-containing protein [Cryptosporidium canis]|nr:zinc finger-containing and myb DNA binding domain-containing protein [Cryptosporidium canis]